VSTPTLIATMPGTRFTKPCARCGEPITLCKTASGKYLPFEVDPVVLKVVQDGESIIRGGRLFEMLDDADRHHCSGERA
jgi:hypothetical protein